MTGWQTGHRGMAFDEGAFFTAIIGKLRALGSTGRLYAWGYSNGAAMANKLAVNGGLGFRGIAASATTLTAAPETYGDGVLAYNFPTMESATEPIAVLSIMGSADRTIPLRGGAFRGSDAILADAKDCILLWSEINQCAGHTTAAVDATHAVSHEEEASTPATRTVFDGCVLPTQYIELSCVGHSGARSIDGQDSMTYAVDFLLGVDAACDVSGASCDDLPVWVPPTPTTWPDYTLMPSCTDTPTSCTCPPSFEVSGGSVWTHPPPPSPSPGSSEGKACSAGCSTEFTICYNFWSRQLDTPGAAYTTCRSQLDQGDKHPRMVQAGCVAHCENTAAMAALDPGSQDGGGAGGGGDDDGGSAGRHSPPAGPPPQRWGGGDGDVEASAGSSFVTSYSSSSFDIQGYTPEACTAATPCPLYIFLTGTGMKVREPELMFVREMGARGFVGGFAVYPQEPYYPQSNGQWDEKAQVVWQGARSALAVLCARAAVDCNLGIAVHGFSQGAGLASLAAQYDSRVGAVLLFAIGTCVQAESSCSKGDGVQTVLQASTQSAYLPINVRC